MHRNTTILTYTYSFEIQRYKVPGLLYYHEGTKKSHHSPVHQVVLARRAVCPANPSETCPGTAVTQIQYCCDRTISQQVTKESSDAKLPSENKTPGRHIGCFCTLSLEKPRLLYCLSTFHSEFMRGYSTLGF